MAFNPKTCLLIPLIGGIGACATPVDDYPSLAIRDVERVAGTLDPAQAAAPYVPPPPAAGTQARLQQLRDQASEAHRAFTAQELRSRAAISALRGAAEGSESWAAGTAALGQLEGLRGRTMVALADLDRIHVDAAVAGEETAGIEIARDEVAALAAQEDAAIARLTGPN